LLLGLDVDSAHNYGARAIALRCIMIMDINGQAIFLRGQNGIKAL
jgi:hypothetical protein